MLRPGQRLEEVRDTALLDIPDQGHAAICVPVASAFIWTQKLAHHQTSFKPEKGRFFKVGEESLVHQLPTCRIPILSSKVPQGSCPDYELC